MYQNSGINGLFPLPNCLQQYKQDPPPPPNPSAAWVFSNSVSALCPSCGGHGPVFLVQLAGTAFSPFNSESRALLPVPA